MNKTSTIYFNNVDAFKGIAILGILLVHCGAAEVRSKNVTSDGLDMIIEVKLRSGENGVVSELREGISKDISVSLLMHDGQVNS